MSRRAVILGATGLVGSHLLRILLEDETYTSVTAYTRTSLDVEHQKLRQITGDLLDEDFFEGMETDDLFCCIGTTQSKTRNLSEYKNIDYGIPVRAARAGLKGGMQQFLVISSMGADPGSRTFYLRVKGQMEKTLQKMQIPQLYIFRPSLLMGQREEFRLGEKIAVTLMKAFSWIIPARYKGIHAHTVALAMCRTAHSSSTQSLLQSHEIAQVAQSEGD